MVCNFIQVIMGYLFWTLLVSQIVPELFYRYRQSSLHGVLFCTYLITVLHCVSLIKTYKLLIFFESCVGRSLCLSTGMSYYCCVFWWCFKKFLILHVYSTLPFQDSFFYSSDMFWVLHGGVNCPETAVTIKSSTDRSSHTVFKHGFLKETYCTFTPYNYLYFENY